MTEASAPQAPPALSRTRECPYRPPAAFAPLRAGGPVTRVRLFNGRLTWLVTGHAEARAILGDPGMSSDRTHPNFPMPIPVAVAPGMSADLGLTTLIGTDPPAHGRQRRMLIPSFTARRITVLRPRIRRIVENRLDIMLAGGTSADLLAAFALPVSSMVICELLGVPYADHDFFEAQSRLRLDPAHGADALRRLHGYLDQLLRHKEADPGEGLLDDLVAQRTAEGALDHRTMVSCALMLLVGGHDTTASMIALGTMALLEHPEQLAALRADAGLLPGAVEELLRYLSIFDLTARVVTRDIEIAGAVIRAGEGVLVANALANYDPAFVERSGELDVRRSARGNLAFGYGIHQCLGHNLARAELEIALQALFDRVPTLRLAVPADRIQAKEGILVGVTELPVAW
jgi:pentalenic acid synthase